MNQCNHKIAVIIVFFGKWPKWIDHFLFSCSKQQELQFIIFSDENPLSAKSRNIRHYRFSVSGFCQLSINKLGISPTIDDPYKVCDFKPTFGKMFEDYLSDFDFWAYSDIDLVYGNLGASNLYALLENYDVISGFKGFASGPFCIYRNTSKINELYTNIKNHINILESPFYLGLDEHIIKNENLGISVKKLFFLFQFLLWKLASLQIFKIRQSQLIYEFQWFLKRKTIKVPVDITEVIYQKRKQGELSACFSDFIVNDSESKRNKRNNWQISYQNGILTDSLLQKEIIIFHFRESKSDEKFIIDDFNSNCSCFKITPNGIRSENE